MIPFEGIRSLLPSDLIAGIEILPASSLPQNPEDLAVISRTKDQGTGSSTKSEALLPPGPG